MNYSIMNGSYYLIENEIYECGRRIKLAKELSNWHLQRKQLYDFPKVKVAIGQGLFVLLHDNETADPYLVCTNGFIDFE